MNNEHWQKFYSEKKAETEESPFADFMEEVIDTNQILYDLGSGNGRDSVFFAEKGIDVISVDPNGKPHREHRNLTHWEINIDNLIKHTKQIKNSTVYSRFFIHAISKKQTKKIIDWMDSGAFIAEFRIRGDEPVIYKDHKRTLWGIIEFEGLFDKDKWNIVFNWVGSGVAKYKEEDPFIMRIKAVRK